MGETNLERKAIFSISGIIRVLGVPFLPQTSDLLVILYVSSSHRNTKLFMTVQYHRLSPSALKQQE